MCGMQLPGAVHYCHQASTHMTSDPGLGQPLWSGYLKVTSVAKWTQLLWWVQLKTQMKQTGTGQHTRCLYVFCNSYYVAYSEVCKTQKQCAVSKQTTTT